MAPDKLASGPQGYQQHPQHQQNQPHPLQAIAATDTAAAATAAATDDSKVKRARRSKPKVKTGCNNCKQRRIKCDEMRPACTQCTRAKKPCSGYPPPARPRLYEEVPIAPKPILAAPSLAAASSSSLPLAARSLHPLQLQQASLYPPTGPQHRQMQYQQQYYPQYQQQYQQSQQSQLTLRRVHKLHIRNYGIQFTYAPSLTLPLSPQHGMYFNLFRQHTASELSGFFDDVFWSRTVLIECHQADAIRHAVVALGALYKTLETTTESPPSSPDAAGVTPSNAADRAANHWEVALDQYSSACHAVGTVDPANPRSQRTCLIASVLLACFDSFIGDHQQAIRQIQTGLKQLWLLRDSRNSQTVLQVAPDGSYVSQPAVPEPVEDELLQMFTRLAIQAKSYDMAFHFPKPYVIYLLPSTEAGFSELSSSDTSGSSPSSPAGSSDVDSPVTVHQDPIPVRFSSLRDARLAWDTLCEDMLRFTEKMFQSASGPPNILPSSMRRYGIHFQARLTGWSAAFGPLLNSRTRPDVSSQEKAGIAVLKMFQIMGQILFFMTFVDSEMQFDNFQPHFAEIVSLAFEVVGDEEQRAAAARCPDPKLCAHQQRQQQQQQQYQQYHPYHQQYGVPSFGPSHIKASFSADLGIVPPLYVVATKSRDRLLRRQAIQLLRSSARREGMWDSELMARIGTWVMEIEERGDGEEDKLRSWQNSAGMLLTPVDSPAPSTVTLPHRQRSPGVDFGDAPLGPGGNARWDVRRESSTSSVRSSASATSGSLPPAPPPIPAEKRVLVKSCEFDLRGHVATLKCGTRGLVAGKVDHKTQVTRITW